MNIENVQIVRKIALGAAIALGTMASVVSRSSHPNGSTWHETITGVGLALIGVCVLGRVWVSLYIGGRKNAELIDIGPYSVVRNPLYLFSIIGAAGAGAQFGSLTMAVMATLVSSAVLQVVVRQEERLLASRYGSGYGAYIKAVPRFLPNPRLWHDVPTITVAPLRVILTFVDASLFLLAVPVAWAAHRFQKLGVLPILMDLP